MDDLGEYVAKLLTTLISVNSVLLGFILIFLAVVYLTPDVWLSILIRIWLIVLVASVFMLLSIYLALDAYGILILMLRLKDPAKRERLSYRLSKRVSLAKNLSILALAILALVVIILATYPMYWR